MDGLIGILNSFRPLLPIQNPMPFFVHNNPLQHWETFPFAEGIERAVLLYENTQEEKSRAIWRDLEDFSIPLLLSYFDQGLTHWVAFGEKESLWQWYCQYIESSWSYKSKALPQLKKNIEYLKRSRPEEVISTILQRRYQNDSDWAIYLQTLIFHFKGWSGIIQNLEKNPSLFPLRVHKVSLVDWVAILVSAEDALIQRRPLGAKSLWNLALIEKRRVSIRRRLLRIQKKEASFLQQVVPQVMAHMIQQRQLLDQQGAKQDRNDDIKVLFCIDDREESLRRALETVNKDYETFGTVGFFGVDFRLKRAGQIIFQPQCPPVINPRKDAEEIVESDDAGFFQRIRRLLPYLNESRFTFVEPILALAFWPIYALALSLRSFSPNSYHRLRKWIHVDRFREQNSKIHFHNGGYSLQEKIDLVADILSSAGFRKIDSRFIILLAHGATTTNNPFQKAYGCGACSGQSGFPNAKVFAEFANNPEVRAELSLRGIVISDRTCFLPAHHDTCSDEVLYAEVSGLDLDGEKILNQFKNDMQKALLLHQQERWQQFKLRGPVKPIARSLDWSQPRPEFGHTGVALSVFGPRWLTKGLDLKRRSFLVSYDPTLDLDGRDLTYNILNALPVCANINMDYFTSAAFPYAFGAGSKLPLNIAAGIGLMPGSKGDLRIGLATQMIDQHEPLRLLALVYCEARHLEMVIQNSVRLQNIIKNNWIHLIRIDPHSLAFEAVTEEIKNEFSFVN